MAHVDTRDPYLFDGKWVHVPNDGVGGGKQLVHKMRTLQTWRQLHFRFQIFMKPITEEECIIDFLIDKLPWNNN